jgi:hypothetical protein
MSLCRAPAAAGEWEHATYGLLTLSLEDLEDDSGDPKPRTIPTLHMFRLNLLNTKMYLKRKMQTSFHHTGEQIMLSKLQATRHMDPCTTFPHMN